MALTIVMLGVVAALSAVAALRSRREAVLAPAHLERASAALDAGDTKRAKREVAAAWPVLVRLFWTSNEVRYAARALDVVERLISCEGVDPTPLTFELRCIFAETSEHGGLVPTRPVLAVRRFLASMPSGARAVRAHLAESSSGLLRPIPLLARPSPLSHVAR